MGGAARAGAGMKIGFIDSGIETSHPGFDDPTLAVPDGFPKTGSSSDERALSNKIIVVRDYEAMTHGGTHFRPYGIRRDGTEKCVVFQVWEWREPWYDLNLYVVQDALGESCRSEVFRATYYAIGIDALMRLMARAGFDHVERRDDVLFQPVIVGVRPATRNGA